MTAFQQKVQGYIHIHIHIYFFLIQKYPDKNTLIQPGIWNSSKNYQEGKEVENSTQNFKTNPELTQIMKLLNRLKVII